MNPTESQQAKQIGLIIHCARVNRGLNQAQLAQAIESTQGTISKLEQGLLVPSITNWFLLTEVLQIPADCCRCGYIDFGQNAKMRHGARECGFKLPTRYRPFRGIKIRYILPLILFFKENVGEDAFFDYVESLNISRAFFVNMDHQINLMFFSDFLSGLISCIPPKTNIYRIITKYASIPISHGKFQKQYLQMKSKFDLMNKFLEKQLKYECFFNYQLIDRNKNWFDLEIFPAFDFDEMQVQDHRILSDEYRNYISMYLEQLTNSESEGSLAAAYSDTSNLEFKQKKDKAKWGYRISLER